MKEAQITLRCSADLRDWLQKQADENRRSLNSELVVVVERARRADVQKQERAA